MTKTLTGWIIILVTLAELIAAFPFNLPTSNRLKRQSLAYLPSSCSSCGSLGYGHGLGNYFYGHYGGGYNNNYGGTNIGSINVQNVSGGIFMKSGGKQWCEMCGNGVWWLEKITSAFGHFHCISNVAVCVRPAEIKLFHMAGIHSTVP
uniref:Uncharacterized protein n=2 Tax=Parascaris TaxID=6254 RepID=A0A914RW09_PAREQ